MELVEDDGGFRQGVLRGQHVGLMHVHGNRLHGFALRFGHRFVAGFQGVAASTIRDVQHGPAVQIANDGHEFAALERLLIDPQHGGESLRPSCQTAIDRSLHDAVGLRPTQTQLPSGRGPAGLLHPVDRQSFEQRRETAAGLRPRHLHLLDPMLGARAARHVGCEDGLELAGVQMPPTARLRVVSRT